MDRNIWVQRCIWPLDLRGRGGMWLLGSQLPEPLQPVGGGGVEGEGCGAWEPGVPGAAGCGLHL